MARFLIALSAGFAAFARAFDAVYAPPPPLEDLDATLVIRPLCDADSPTEFFDPDELPVWATAEEVARSCRRTLIPTKG